MKKVHRRQAIWAGVAAFALTLMGAAVLDLADAWESARAELVGVADRIDQRSMRVRQEIGARVAELPQDEACDQAALRRMLSRLHHVRNVGKIRGTRIYCDALDGAEASISLGTPQVTRIDGLRIWLGSSSIWGARGTNAVMVDAQSLIDAILPSDTTVALVEIESGRSMVGTAPLPAGLLAAAWRATDVTLVKDAHLVAVRRSSDGRTLALATRPLAAIREQAWQALPVFLLAGSLFGLGLATAVVVALSRHRSLREELRRAVKHGLIKIELQPIVSPTDAPPSIAGFELLARWQPPDSEQIPASVFVPLVETEGLGPELARCMLTLLMRDFGDTLRANPDLHVSLNLSSTDVADVSLLDDLERIVANAGIKPRQLVIELTERIFEYQGLAAGLQRLRAAGYWLSIDDFGTGASNASRLATFGPEMVKVDRSFVVHADGNSPAAALLAQLVAMARSVGARVVVEGIETASQAQLIAEFGDIYAQGYYWHRPMSPLQATELVAEERRRLELASDLKTIPAATH